METQLELGTLLWSLMTSKESLLIMRSMEILVQIFQSVIKFSDLKNSVLDSKTTQDQLLLQSGVEAVGLNTGARTNVIGVDFTSTTGANAYVSGTIDVQIKSGSLIEGDQYSYITSAATGAAISLTISSTAGANKLRFTTDPTTDIPVSTVVFLNDADNSSFSSGYYQVASI